MPLPDSPFTAVEDITIPILFGGRLQTKCVTPRIWLGQAKATNLALASFDVHTHGISGKARQPLHHESFRRIHAND